MMEMPKPKPVEGKEAERRFQWAKNTLASLVEQAERGDRSARAQMENVFAEFPALRATVAQFHGLYAWAVAKCIKKIAKFDLLLAEGIRSKVREIEARLFRPGICGLERMLAEDVVLAYLAYRSAQIEDTEQPFKTEFVAVLDRHLESTGRQWTAAIRAYRDELDRSSDKSAVPSGRRRPDPRGRRPNDGERRRHRD
jgi:hypothetical protein